MDVKIDATWKEQLHDEFEKAYFRQLTAFVRQEYKQHLIFPPGPELFSAFDHCPFDRVKVVILGQDPYHEPGQAHGLCFSVKEGTPPPPSLVNIYKEIESDLGKPTSTGGDLTSWADQGILLLNATLTVRAHQAGSHQNKGWETFTDAVIDRLTRQRRHIVYLLWGAYAQRKGAFIDTSANLVLKSAHPSPLAAYRGFFGCRHFSKANDYLIATGQTPINW